MSPTVAIPAASCAVLLALPAAAQTIKLNGPLAREVIDEFTAPLTSPDGSYVVYSTREPMPMPNAPFSATAELFSTALASKQGPVLLRDTGPDIFNVQITRDGRHVLFLEGDLGGTIGNRSYNELATVPIDGSGPPVVLSPVTIQSYQASPDAVHVLYLTREDTAAVPSELFSASIAGGSAPVKLNGELVPGGRVWAFAISNDGHLAAYSAHQDTDEFVELFVVPADGSLPAQKLPVPLVTGGIVASFAFDADASHVIYLADQEEDEHYELFSIRTDGSQAPQKLNGPLVPGGSVGTRYGTTYFYPSFALTPDGRWVVYSADQEEDERFELFGVPADGSRLSVKLSTATDRDVQLAALSYDSAWAVYQSDPSSTDAYELFGVPVDGSVPARPISGPMAPGTRANNAQISFDSRRVVYEADRGSAEVSEIYGAPIDGSAPPVRLNSPLPTSGGLRGWAVMRDGVVYAADQEQDDLFELYFTPIDGGLAPRRIAVGPVAFFTPSQSHVQSPPLDFGKVMFAQEDALLSVGVEPGTPTRPLAKLAPTVMGDVRDFQLAPAGDRVIYRALEQGDQTLQSYSAGTSKQPGRVPFHPELAVQWPPRLVSDGSLLVFVARRIADRVLGLYSAPADGSGTATLLRDSLGESFGNFALSPDGRRVAFLAVVSSYWSLFSAPVDGSSPALELSAGLPAGSSVSAMKISEDGGVVAFLATVPNRGGSLYTVPIDGSGPALLVSSHRVSTNFDVSPRGERVVYLDDESKVEIFSASSDASAPEVRLNGTMPTSGDVTAFAISPDGTHVVYLADQNINGTFELFSARIEGGGPPVRLHAALSAGRDVSDFQISSDGRRVVYRADALVDGQDELFSVPIDASRLPLRLNGPLVSGGHVGEYRISPDGRRVVYLADQEKDEVVELYSTSIQGGRGQSKLSRPLVPGGDVDSFEISADSRTVVFAPERPVASTGGDAPERFTLMTVPIDGLAKATELAGPFQGDGSVVDYRVSADASVVVYRADQDHPGVIELYAAACARPRDRAIETLTRRR